MDKWKVVYYVSRRGENPVKEFLDARPKTKLKVFRLFQNIQEFGLNSIIPHIKKLSGTPLWEIRILGEDSIRILYVTKKGNRILLLHGFVKKTNKTSKKEIDTALDRLLDFRDL